MGFDVNSIINVLGMLSAVIIVITKLKPGMDDYFRKGTPIIAEIDDVIDAILVEFPDNKALNNFSDLLDKVLSELKQAGYKLEPEDQKKIENRLKARLKRDKNFKLDFDSQNKKYQIKYETEF